MPRRQAQAEYVAGGGNWIAESPYYRSLPTFIDDITRDFGSDAYERMMLDDQVAGSVRTFVVSILSEALTVRPYIDDDKDPDYQDSKTYAEFTERNLGNLLHRMRRSVDAWLFEVVGGSVSLGNRVTEKVAALEESGQDAGRLVWDRLKVKPRNRTAFVVDQFSNLLGLLAAIPGQGNLVPGAILTPDLLEVSNLLPLEKFAILSWNPQEEDPRGTSLLRTVYKLWWEKIQATAEWLKHLTQFGSPSVWGTTAPDAMEEPARDSLGNPLPGAVSISPVQQLLNELLKFRNGYALALPNGSTLQLLQSANAGDSFFKMIEHHERAIDRAILLASRTRMEAKHGSKADAEASQDVTEQAVRQAKTWAAEMVTRDLIYPPILWNFGADAAKRLCPYATLSPVEKKDWSQVANAISPMVASGFVKPSQFPTLYTQLGLPPAEEPLTDDQQQGAAPLPAPGDEDFPAATATATEAPFAAGEYEEVKHPRGYGGKWANKPGAESDPEDVRSSRVAAEQLRQQAQGAAPSLARLLHEMARAVEPYGPFHRPPQVKPYDARADRQQLDQEPVGKVLARAVKRREAAHQAQDRTLLWAGGGVEHFGKDLMPAQKQRIQDQVQADKENNRRAVQRLKAAEESLRARTPPAAQPLTPKNLSRASLVFFHERGDVQQRESTKQKQEEGATAASLLRGVPRADVLALHGARIYFLPKGWQADGLSSLPGLSAINLKSGKRQEDPENSPAGLLWSHSAAPVQIPVDQVPPDARYGGQSQRSDTGTFEPAKVDQYKRLSKSLYVRQKAGEELAYDIVPAKDVPRLIGIPKHLVAEFAEYEEHRHPRGYGGKWAPKGTDQTHEQHTEQLTWRGKVASLLRQALSQPGKSVARVLAAAEALHDAYRQGGFKAVPKVAVLAAYRKAKVSFAKLETRYGRKAAIAMAGAYLSCYAAYAANPVLMLYLPSPTAAILGTAEALRVLGKGARRLAGKKGEAAFDEEWTDFLEEIDCAEFAFGLPTPYEEGKHPRGYGGKWTNKGGGSSTGAATSRRAPVSSLPTAPARVQAPAARATVATTPASRTPLRPTDEQIKQFGERLQNSSARGKVQELLEQHVRPVRETSAAINAAGNELVQAAARGDEKARRTAGLEFERQKARLQPLRDEAKGRIHEALKAANPVPMPVEFPLRLRKETRDGAVTGAGWLSQRMERTNGAEILQVQVRPSAEGRPYYSGNFYDKAQIHLARDEIGPAGVMVHELGHAVEEQLPGARAAALAFLYHRVGDEALTSMNDAAHTEAYGAEEKGRKDNFDGYFGGGRAYYVGLDYQDRATEVLSMGVEALYNDPVTFIQADPEYAAFVVGILSGEFRGAT